MRKEAKIRAGIGITLLAGAAALSGKADGSPIDAMGLPGEGMFRRDSQGSAFQVRGGEWVKLSKIDAGESVFDGQAGLTRLTSIQDRSAPESYRFSHFIGDVNYNKNEKRWEVAGCYSTAGGRSCDALFEVPKNRVNEINSRLENQR